MATLILAETWEKEGMEDKENGKQGDCALKRDMIIIAKKLLPGLFSCG
jgi:hypothetical protein